MEKSTYQKFKDTLKNATREDLLRQLYIANIHKEEYKKKIESLSYKEEA